MHLGADAVVGAAARDRRGAGSKQDDVGTLLGGGRRAHKARHAGANHDYVGLVRLGNLVLRHRVGGHLERPGTVVDGLGAQRYGVVGTGGTHASKGHRAGGGDGGSLDELAAVEGSGVLGHKTNLHDLDVPVLRAQRTIPRPRYCPSQWAALSSTIRCPRGAASHGAGGFVRPPLRAAVARKHVATYHPSHGTGDFCHRRI